MIEKSIFSDHFLWGVAGAAHQIEGNNINSDSWVLEHLPDAPFAEPSGDACNHFELYHDDIALIAALGFNSYRFSIEWARIEPEPGEFSQAMLDHYRRMLEACHEHNLTPVVTYHHFTSPRWFAARGGWEVPENADLFARYCARATRATRALGDLIGAACTLNEPNLGLMGQRAGWMPADAETAQAPYRAAAAKAVGSDRFSSFPSCCLHELARDTFIKGHRLAFDAIKAGPGRFPVGLTLALDDLQALPGGEALRDRVRRETQDIFLDAARQDDFIGVQTYTRSRFGPDGPIAPEPDAERTQMYYEFYPEALEGTIRYAAAYTGRPVIVTENGIGTADDTRRVEYIRRALQGVDNCRRDGIDVRGYFYWSVFDNFEWSLGYRPTFGLIAVDRATQRRALKPSADYLGGLARASHRPD